MQPSKSIFVDESDVCFNYVGSNNSFMVHEVAWQTSQLTREGLYQQLVNKVVRKPKQLIYHLQRIYFTYEHEMADHLYAALVDLMWVLGGKGKPLSFRMFSATSSLLSEQQRHTLSEYFKKNDVSVLSGNPFSIFSKGLVGFSRILIEQDKSNTGAEYDVLRIARDYVEYSQLDQAMEILEFAILESPERLELQTELLELYVLTKKHQPYTEMTHKLKERKIEMSIEWQDAEKYFIELNHEE